MANQSTSAHVPYMVYYEELGRNKKFEMSQWAKRKLIGEPPYTERIRRKAVEKWSKIKSGIAKALSFSYTNKQ